MLDWLLIRLGLRRAAYVAQAIEGATRDAFMQGHLQGQRAGQDAAYQVGFAHGELHGRREQVLELQREFGVENNHNVFEAEDALRYGARLKH